MVTLMIIMIMMMMIMITIMMLMVMRRMKPSLWLKILSKLISPVFSRYLIITDLTIIPISIQVLIKSISILISQKNYTSDQPHARIWQDDLFARPSSWKIFFALFCSILLCLKRLRLIYLACIYFFPLPSGSSPKRLLFSSFNSFAILIFVSTLTDKIFITDVFLKSLLL